MCNSFDYSVAYNAKSWKHICKRLIKLWYTYIRSSQGALVVKHLPANAGDVRRRFDPWVRKIPWRRAWQPTPVFLPGESPQTEEPGRLQSMGSQRVRQDGVTH